LNKKSTQKMVVYVILVFFAVLALIPILYMISSSFKTNREVYTNFGLVPKHFYLKNYVEVWESIPLARMFINSFIVAGVSTLSMLFFSALAGYSFSQLSFKAKNYLFYLILTSFMVPPNVAIVPLFNLTRRLHFLNTYQGLIGPYIGYNLAFSMFIMKTAFDGVPRELQEAAMIDGCPYFKIFLKIMLPMIKPTLAVVTVYSFMFTYNEFLLALTFLNQEEMYTLPLFAIFYTAQILTPWGIIFAGSSLIVLPVILLYVVFQKTFVKGLTAGAVKG